MTIQTFFDEPTEQSRIKAQIVSKYFSVWAQVVIPPTKKRGGDRVAFVDLFAGPGKYGNEVPSTPLRVLGSAVKNPDLRKMLVAIFNDARPDRVRSLREAIESNSEFRQFRHPPKVFNYQVGNELVDQLEAIRTAPTLTFVDPFGYKGLSLRLIDSFLKNWGSDCIIFFNYNRINPGLNNEKVKEHMDALFGPERAERLRARLQRLKPHERELAIIEEIANALKAMGGKFVLPFRFRNERGTRTRHHLIFVSKHFRGYAIMKEIMAGESSTADQGVPSFEYNPATKDYPLLFELTRPLDELEGQLMDRFAGRTVKMHRIYEVHSVGRPFLEKHYKEALKNLEARGAVETNPPASRRRPNTFVRTSRCGSPSVPGSAAAGELSAAMRARGHDPTPIREVMGA